MRAASEAPSTAVPLNGSDTLNGTAIWVVTNLVVIGAGFFSWYFVKPYAYKPDSVFDAMSGWDGVWYTRIAEGGYTFEPGVQSSPAFFPAYPLLGRLVAVATGLSIEESLFVVAQVLLLAAFILFHRYVRLRYPDDGRHLAALSLTALAVFPATFFYHMLYTESLFILIVISLLLAIRRKAPLWLIACLVGLSTATRGAGVGLIPVVLGAAWSRSENRRAFLGRCAYLLPISVWGIAAYMWHLHEAVGDPLAFVKAQEGWNFHPGTTAAEKWIALVTLKPIWASFIHGSPHSFSTDPDAAFSISAVNSVVFVLAAFLVLVGAWRRWLTAAEILCSAGMLGVAYLSKAYENNMLSFARFASATPPIYMVMAMLLVRAEPIFTWAYLIVCTALMALVTILFTAGYHVI